QRAGAGQRRQCPPGLAGLPAGGVCGRPAGQATGVGRGHAAGRASGGQGTGSGAAPEGGSRAPAGAGRRGPAPQALAARGKGRAAAASSLDQQQQPEQGAASGACRGGHGSLWEGEAAQHRASASLAAAACRAGGHAGDEEEVHRLPKQFEAHMQQARVMNERESKSVKLAQYRATVKTQEEVIANMQGLLAQAVARARELAPLTAELESTRKQLEEAKSNKAAAAPSPLVAADAAVLAENVELKLKLKTAEESAAAARNELFTAVKRYAAELAECKHRLAEKDAQLMGGFGAMGRMDDLEDALGIPMAQAHAPARPRSQPHADSAEDKRGAPPSSTVQARRTDSQGREEDRSSVPLPTTDTGATRSLPAKTGPSSNDQGSSSAGVTAGEIEKDIRAQPKGRSKLAQALASQQPSPARQAGGMSSGHKPSPARVAGPGPGSGPPGPTAGRGPGPGRGQGPGPGVGAGPVGPRAGRGQGPMQGPELMRAPGQEPGPGQGPMQGPGSIRAPGQGPGPGQGPMQGKGAPGPQVFAGGGRGPAPPVTQEPGGPGQAGGGRGAASMRV
ncbi:uncharacterized protein HaLaN_27422, partial [Haematococcus lacustris]